MTDTIKLMRAIERCEENLPGATWELRSFNMLAVVRHQTVGDVYGRGDDLASALDDAVDRVINHKHYYEDAPAVTDRTYYSDKDHLRLVQFHIDAALPWLGLEYGIVEIQIAREMLMASIKGESVSISAIAYANGLSDETVRRKIKNIEILTPAFSYAAARGDKDAQKTLLDWNREYSDIAMSRLVSACPNCQ